MWHRRAWRCDTRTSRIGDAGRDNHWLWPNISLSQTRHPSTMLACTRFGNSLEMLPLHVDLKGFDISFFHEHMEICSTPTTLLLIFQFVVGIKRTRPENVLLAMFC